MTQVKLIKRATQTTQHKSAEGKAARQTTQTIVKEWLSQYQQTKPNNPHAAFAALFAETQLS